MESQPGQGATFQFTVRCECAAAGETIAPATPEVDLRGQRVLVVDDIAAHREVLGSYLRSWQMRPELAAGGKEALALMRDAAASDHPFDLVIMDLVMPDMDGFALGRGIQRDPPSETSPGFC